MEASRLGKNGNREKREIVRYMRRGQVGVGGVGGGGKRRRWRCGGELIEEKWTRGLTSLIH